MIPLPENHHDDKYLYEVIVETGFKQECSTTADVMIVITGIELFYKNTSEYFYNKYRV